MNSVKVFLAGLAGAAAVILVQGFLEEDQSHSGRVDTARPLYWVAPMDPSYRREGPGKSPMGMDLVPVYADHDQAAQAGSVHRRLSRVGCICDQL